MKLYLISQNINDSYDTYDSAIVCARNEIIAKNMNPDDGTQITDEQWKDGLCSWAKSKEDVQIEFLGNAKKGSIERIILASFNAG